MAETKNVAITAALITAAATIIAALIAVFGGDGGGGDGGSANPPGVNPQIPGDFSASIFTNRDSGAGGTEVRVSGEGFAPGERVVISFHTEEMGSTTTNAEGKFSNVTLTIPSTLSDFAPQQFDIVARGADSFKSASTPFTLSG